MSEGSPYPAGKAGEQADPDLVRSELERLFKSDQFKNSRRCQTLLRYLVEETIAGRGTQLKERLVGINVFGRDPGYDTAEDPVVRNAAIEVRKRLAQFYVQSEKDPAARIELHPGTYVPEFRCATKAPKIPQSQTQPEPPPPALPPAQVIPSRRRWPVRLAIGTFAVLLCVAAVILLIHFRVIFTSGPSGGQSSSLQSPVMAASSASPAAATVAHPVRILAGDMKSGPYVDRFGHQWSPDRYFKGGTVRDGVTNFFFPPADPQLFRTMRQGSFSYDIPLKPKQLYELRLYFVEPQYRYGDKIGGDGEGNRIFQVRANGRVILNNFDIIEDSGFASTTIRAFRDIKAGKDGKLHLQFVAHAAQPVVSAIALLPETAGAIPPIRIHAAPYYYTDHAGNRWSPDNYYIGGSLQGAGASVTGTPDAGLFSVARLGNFHYAIPVPPGRYALTLYFAETWFHSPGERVFNVSCNGQMLIHRLDIYKKVGFAHVLKETFHGLQPNGQGKLLIAFSPIVNYASVRALQVVQESP